LEKQNQETKIHYRKNNNDLMNDLQEQTRLAEELAQNLTMAQDENQSLLELCEEWKEKAEQYDRTAAELETTQNQLSSAQMKIKELEYEVSSFGDWKNLSKVRWSYYVHSGSLNIFVFCFQQASHSRLNAASDIEKEVIKLRQDTKNLRESVGNKLLLEEQVNDLKNRLEKYENNYTDSVALEVSFTIFIHRVSVSICKLNISK
jgi:mitotic spindle assembly checkpoint protein MAD1